MNKRLFVFVVFIIALALLGLVSIQLYWINSAMTLKEANFKRSVSEAVTNTIHKLEKIEIANQIRNRVYGTKHDASIFSTLDSINELFVGEMEKMLSYYTTFGTEEGSYTTEKISIKLSEYELEKSRKLIDTSVIEVDTISDVRRTTAVPLEAFTPQLPPEFSDSISKEIDAFLKKTFIVSDVFEDIFCLKQYQSIDKRISMPLLDSILTIELSNKGINAFFEFGIYNPGKNKFSYERTGSFSKALLEEGYAYNLFPTDLFITPEYFLIYFPFQKSFLLTRMWVMLTVSFLLIALMLLSFVYAISTILKQRKLSEMKNDFINNMTHEFKTPVSTIALTCEALQDKHIEKTPELYKAYLNIISEENKRLGVIAENVLQTAIVDKGKLKLNIEEVDIHKVLEQTIDTLELQVKRNNASVISDFRASRSVILGDSSHLRNVFNNLLDNALKYTQATPTIKIFTENFERGIKISIKDNGIGIAKSHHKKIFDRLYRVPIGNLHNVKGFGLGLSYVKTIVEMHEGKIMVESEIKKGATFIIYLPFSKSTTIA